MCIKTIADLTISESPPPLTKKSDTHWSIALRPHSFLAMTDPHDYAIKTQYQPHERYNAGLRRVCALIFGPRPGATATDTHSRYPPKIIIEEGPGNGSPESYAFRIWETITDFYFPWSEGYIFGWDQHDDEDGKFNGWDMRIQRFNDFMLPNKALPENYREDPRPHRLWTMFLHVQRAGVDFDAALREQVAYINTKCAAKPLARVGDKGVVAGVLAAERKAKFYLYRRSRDDELAWVPIQQAAAKGDDPYAEVDAVEDVEAVHEIMVELKKVVADA